MKVELNLCDGKIKLNLNQAGTSGTIKSQLKEKGCKEWNAFVDALEALILAQACEGMDVTTAAYQRAVQSAIDAGGNHLD